MAGNDVLDRLRKYAGKAQETSIPGSSLQGQDINSRLRYYREQGVQNRKKLNDQAASATVQPTIKTENVNPTAPQAATPKKRSGVGQFFASVGAAIPAGITDAWNYLNDLVWAGVEEVGKGGNGPGMSISPRYAGESDADKAARDAQKGKALFNKEEAAKLKEMNMSGQAKADTYNEQHKNDPLFKPVTAQSILDSYKGMAKQLTETINEPSMEPVSPDDNPIEKARKESYQLGKNIVKPIDEWADTENAGYLTQAVAGGVRSLPSTVAAMAPGGWTLTFASEYRQLVEQKYNEAVAKGGPIDYVSLQAYAAGASLIDAATEQMSNVGAGLSAGSASAKATGGKMSFVNGVKGFFEGAMNYVDDGLEAPTIGKFISFLTQQGVNEGMEEVWSAYGQGLLAKITTDKDVKLSSITRDQGGLINLEDISQQFIGGAALGFLIPAINNTKGFVKTRAAIKEVTGLPLNKITEAQMEHIVNVLQADYSTKEGKAGLQSALAESIVKVQPTNEVVQDSSSGMLLNVKPASPGGLMALVGEDGKTMLTVSQDEYNAGLQKGIFTLVKQATPAMTSQAVTDSSLPGQTAQQAPTAAGVAPAMAARGTAQSNIKETSQTTVNGETRREASTTYTAKNGQQAPVKSYLSGKEAIVEVTAPDSPIPYYLRFDPGEYRQADNKGLFLQKISALAKGGKPLHSWAQRYINPAQYGSFYSTLVNLANNTVKNAEDTVKATQAEEEAAKKQKEDQAKAKEEEAVQMTAEGVKGKQNRELSEEDTTVIKKAREASRQAQKGKIDDDILAGLKASDKSLESYGIDGYYNLTPKEKLSREHKAIQKIVEDATGKKVVFVYAVGADEINEFVTDLSNEIIFVNSNREKTTITWAIGHGLYHLMSKEGQSKEFENAVFAAIGTTREELVESKLAEYDHIPEYQKGLRKETYAAIEEAIADRAGDVFSSGEFWTKLAETAKGQKIIEKVRDWLAGIKKTLPVTSPEVDAMLKAIIKSQENESRDLMKNAILGKTVQSAIRPNEYIDAQYAVVDISQLIASHDLEGNINAKYDQDLQPRDRGRVDSKMNINDIINNVDPQQLVGGETVKNGAPVVDKFGMVESGNGRVIAIQEFYKRRNSSAKKYSDYIGSNLSTFGIDSSTLPENPVLVRIRQTDVDRQEFTRAANVSDQAQMSASEVARTDAEKLDKSILALADMDESGDINSASNRDFIRAFISDIVPSAERGQVIRDDGQISASGINRIRNTLFFKAYNSLKLLDLMAEATDSNIKTIINAMVKASPKVISTRRMIDSGTAYDMDISNDIAQAAEKYGTLSLTSVAGIDPVESYVKQTKLVPDENMTSIAENLLKILYAYRRSAKMLAGFINDFYDGIYSLGNPGEQSLFGDSFTPDRNAFIDKMIEKELAKNGRRTEEGQQTDTPPLLEYARTAEKNGAIHGSEGIGEEAQGWAEEDSKPEITPKSATLSDITKKLVPEFDKMTEGMTDDQLLSFVQDVRDGKVKITPTIEGETDKAKDLYEKKAENAEPEVISQDKADRLLQKEYKFLFNVGDQVSSISHKVGEEGKSMPYIIADRYIENGEARYKIYPPGKKADMGARMWIKEEEITPRSTTVNSYEQKQLDRAERLRKAAEKARAESITESKAADKIMSFIPMGQPILVGHHSEGRHRRDLDKVDSHMGKSVEAQKKAEYYDGRAEAAESNKVISLDDPDAVAKLTAKIANLESQRERIKDTNAGLRKESKEGYAPYVLQNLGANIRATKLRLDQAIKLAEKRQTSTGNNTRHFDGLDIVENIEANRLQLLFDGKPAADTITLLKQSGFRWSPTEGAWQRQLTNAARYSAKRIIEQAGISKKINVQFSAKKGIDPETGEEATINKHRFSRFFTEDYFSKPTLDKLTDLHNYYKVQTNKETVKKAADMLQSNERAAWAAAHSIENASAVHTTLRQFFLMKADLSGKPEEAADWAYVINKAGKNVGQAVQAYAIFKKLTPGAQIYYAGKELLGTLTPDQWQRIEDMSEEVKAEMKSIDLDAAKKVLGDITGVLKEVNQAQEDVQRKLEAAQRLEDRIKEYSGVLDEFDSEPVKDFIEALHGVAAVTQPFDKLPKTGSPVSFMAWALKNINSMKDAWSTAYQMMLNMHGQDETYMAEIEAYLGEFIPELEQQAEQKANITPEMAESIKKALEEHYEADETFNSMIKRLVELGVDPGDSVLIAREAQKQIGKLTQEQKMMSLRKILPKAGKRTLEDQLMKMVNVSNERGLTDAEIQGNVAKMMGLPGMTTALSNEISELSKGIADINEIAASEGRPLTEEEERQTDVLMAMMLSAVQREKPVHWTQKVDLVQSMIMMSMFKSAERNILGNTMFAAVDTGKDIVAAGIDRIVSQFTGNKTIPLPQLGAAISGAIKGGKYSAYDIAHDIDTGILNTQYDVPHGTVFKSKLGRLAMRVFRYKMSLPDRVYQGAAYQSYLTGTMKMNNAAEPTKEMKEAAEYYAQYKTFADDNTISNALSQLRKILNLNGKSRRSGSAESQRQWGFGSFVIKFPRIPGALLMRTIDYSPVSLGKALFYLAKPMFDAKKFGGTYKEHFKQQKFAFALANGTYGTATSIGVGILLSMLGLMTGRAPDDDKEKRMLETMGIARGYQLNWTGLWRFVTSGFDVEAAQMQPGDKFATYSWMAPMSLGMAIGANIIQETKDIRESDEPTTEKAVAVAIDAFSSGLDSITEMSVMSGVFRFMENFKYTDSTTEALLMSVVNVPASFIPQQLKIMREMIDNTQRTTYDNDPLTYAYNLLLNRLPGASKTLAPAVDSLGNLKEVYQDNGNNVWNVFFNPAWTNKYQPNEAAIMVLNTMSEKEGTSLEDDNVTPTKLKGYITYTDAKGMKQKITLTAQEKAELQQKVGSEVERIFMTIPSTWPLEAKVKAMTKILNEVSHAYKMQLLARKLAAQKVLSEK